MANGGWGAFPLRFGEPVDVVAEEAFNQALRGTRNAGQVSRFALDLVHQINRITPVTTTSPVAIALLSKYALTKRAIESRPRRPHVAHRKPQA
ncbi:MAG: hypothetical protein R2825_18975 [Saprospiraceae bacterium]